MKFPRKIFGPLAAILVTSACNVSNTEQLSKSVQLQSDTAGVAIQSTSSPFNRETAFKVYLTGYSYWDNTPPGSAAISKPVIHRRAGGRGTYTDPITLAVGHSIIGRRQTLDYPAGTKFYLKNLRKYAIVEDVCGDGNRPQNGPCHTGKNGYPWIDIYVDGSKSPSRNATQCAYNITSFQTVIMNPRSDYPVVIGPLTETGCQVFSG